MKVFLRTSSSLVGLVLFTFITVAHCHEALESPSETMNMEIPPPSSIAALTDPVVTYFGYKHHFGWMVAHILLMTIGWLFVLPIVVMLSISRSRFSLLAQITFFILNMTGILFAIVYNAKTPDLYPNNAHHKLSWWLTWIITVQLVVVIITRCTTEHKENMPNLTMEERESFIPVSTAAMAEHQRIQDLRTGNYRFSNDSGQGTEPNTESLRSHSISSAGGDEQQLADLHGGYDDVEIEKQGVKQRSKIDRFLNKRLRGLLSLRVLGFFHLVDNLVDRIILILAFMALITGFITFGGFFMGDQVFSGLAHFIKGGVFFWFGVLTLARWAGSFADIGWAWNIKPVKARKANRPSAEFVESFLIFFYGLTNVFLEHLAAWGAEWSAQDLEHISITIMFFGGGLCGMLIESIEIRSLLNAGIEPSAASTSGHQYSDDGDDILEPPKSYRFSMNPLPALIILLLGLMMSSHHQHSMVSTMIHQQWGSLLVGAAFARAATYVIFYLAPPTSIFPSRPPSELITAFCLMAGGMIFMASSKDTVETIELHDLDGMFVFTVSMGIIMFLMAWIIVVIAIKGWAVRRERKSNLSY